MNKVWQVILYPFTLILNLIDNLRISKLLSHATTGDIDKIDGTDFEKVIAYLFSKMHFKVKLTPVSGDYGADLIVAKWHIKIAIQCKLYYGHNVGNKAVNEVYGAKSYYGCDEAMVITNSYYTKNAKELATSVNVVLLDRDFMGLLLRKPYKNNAKLVLNQLLISKEKAKFSK